MPVCILASVTWSSVVLRFSHAFCAADVTTVAQPDITIKLPTNAITAKVLIFIMLLPLINNCYK
jgi:hypothetical protein